MICRVTSLSCPFDQATTRSTLFAPRDQHRNPFPVIPVFVAFGTKQSGIQRPAMSALREQSGHHSAPHAEIGWPGVRSMSMVETRLRGIKDAVLGHAAGLARAPHAIHLRICAATDD